ncbi:Txe/YoeB family addiction module toxin [Flavobacterium azooxidireducens]|uniref:Putative mRNA interferase YoeB n=1 Tax=Flavobacterium azooxidireducens TaxID=1871076 RepID=A0ABY4KB17_9FLAO|nr:Txe/YoeB family addiction module toxin [Flavobacterium azooxidireducens]UPQ77759.1 Txe/YoeB family addiction module toxin [Flavobacterium azooxidireducens]
MSYAIELTNQALEDIEKHKKSGDKKILLKIDKLLNELRKHPTTGTGKPEKLKHYNIATWSRRITDKHRLIYRIEDEKITVLVLSFWGHYEDK